MKEVERAAGLDRSIALCTAGALSVSSGASARDVEAAMRSQAQAVDSLAVRIYATDAMQQAQAQIAELYRTDPKAADPASAALIEQAAAATAMGGAMLAANRNPAAPKVQWWNTRAHTWPGGPRVPDSRFGLDNPDNFYVQFPVDGTASYRLVGAMPANRPTDITLSVLDEFYHESDVVTTISILTGEDITADADGRFVITIGPEAGEGRSNHLRTSPAARVVQVRQTIGDWTTEDPFPLYVERAGPAPSQPEPSLARLAEDAARTALTTARVWGIGFPLRLYENVPANTMTPMFSAARFGGLATQMSSGGHFVLAEDQALIIRARTHSAGYYSLQLGDQWMVSAEYVERTGNLNNRQVVEDGDGTVTFVISPADPGVCNWADPGPIRDGYIALRLQNVPKGVTDGEPLLETRLVPLADLKGALPAGTKLCSPNERKVQIADRIAGWDRRMRAIMGD